MAHHLKRPVPRYDCDDLATAILGAQQELIAPVEVVAVVAGEITVAAQVAAA